MNKLQLLVSANTGVLKCPMSHGALYFKVLKVDKMEQFNKYLEKQRKSSTTHLPQELPVPLTTLNEKMTSLSFRDAAVHCKLIM